VAGSYESRFRRFRGCWSAVALMLTFGAPSSVLAYRSGPPAGVNGSTASFGSSCRVCHGSSIGSGSVQIIGFPAQYMSGATYPIQVRVADPTQAGAGFQISFETPAGVHAGTMLRTDTLNTQLNSGWLNHTSTGVDNAVANWTFMGHAAAYTLSWRAPLADIGPITAWAAGNAINNNLADTGDIIYLTSRTATFAPGRGACCDEFTGTCTENSLLQDCSMPSDRYGGDGSTCATIDPPCTLAPSGCCDGATGQCTDGLTAEACAGLSDQTTYYEHIPCARLGEPGFPPGCERHRGACCDHSPGAGGPGGDGLCAEHAYPEDCGDVQQTWHKGLLCADIECLETTGACCDTLTGDCVERLIAAECTGLHRRWTKGASCTDVPCDAVPGACCDPDPFGGCSETTQAECACDQCVWHKLLTCPEIECVHTPIPTVSEWGLVVLTLLLLTGAKVSFDRRSELGSP
jgi:hypothetical protein